MHEIEISLHYEDIQFYGLEKARFKVSIYCSFTDSHKVLATVNGKSDAIIFALAKSKDLAIPFDVNKFYEEMKKNEKKIQKQKKKDC